MVVLSVVTMAMAQEQPANFACPNYPFCAITPTPAAAIASIPGYDLVMQQRANLNAPLVAHVPGIDQWYAALHQVGNSFSSKLANSSYFKVFLLCI